jgi:hypothetical protein
MVILAGTLSSFHLPVEAPLIILGVDEIMDMARTTVNVIGNCLATIIAEDGRGSLTTGKPGKQHSAKNSAVFSIDGRHHRYEEMLREWRTCYPRKVVTLSFQAFDSPGIVYDRKKLSYSRA